ncbi:MAG: reverse transcriptase domain-containing protein, partial [Planctomyces sp.]
ADWDNLASAAWRASAGKRGRYEVRSFLANLLPNLSELRRDILDGTVSIGQGRAFWIRDPKPRLITAACFRERVLQHALMWHVGPLLERALVADTFACLTGRGTGAAVRRTQEHVRRFPWYAKMDVRKYFASIDHDVLRKLLRRRLKGAGMLELVDRIIDAYGDGNGRGLPIGALTSQWFANYYLGPLDRFLLERRRVAGMVRYMDDFVFWGATRDEVRSCADGVDEFLNQTLNLKSRPPTLINRSSHGVTVCGYRVFPGTIQLSRTRRDRFAQALMHWESEWLSERISSLELQRRIDATLGMTVDADARNWIGECVHRRSRSDVIERLDAIKIRISHDDE